MPWKPSDAPSHTKKADTPRRRRMWADVANSEKKRGLSDARCIRAADAAVAADHAREKKKKKK